MLLQSRQLSKRPDLVHGFTTRVLADDWAAICRVTGMQGVARAVQVHGCGVLCSELPGQLGEGDAIVVSSPGLLAAVRVADCVPILLAAPAGSPGAVAAVHAGWRGTVAGVVNAALERLCERAGCSPEQVQATIGPSIALPSYEVGPEVLQAVRRLTDAPVIRGRHLDLKATNAALLSAAGVVDIEVLPQDTFTDERLWSYRRDGPGGGRQVGFIGLLPDAESL